MRSSIPRVNPNRPTRSSVQRIAIRQVAARSGMAHPSLLRDCWSCEEGGSQVEAFAPLCHMARGAVQPYHRHCLRSLCRPKRRWLHGTRHSPGPTESVTRRCNKSNYKHGRNTSNNGEGSIARVYGAPLDSRCRVPKRKLPLFVEKTSDEDRRIASTVV